jgi:hypothetical protein
MNATMRTFAAAAQQMNADAQRLAALMEPAQAATQALNAQLASLNASAKAITDLFDPHSPQGRTASAALAARHKELAEHHAGLSARLAYVIKAAEKRGRATHFLVLLALSGDSEAQKDLRISALRGDSFAACVLALIAEIAANDAPVFALAADVASAAACIAFERIDFTALEPPQRVRAGTASPNGPPVARHALGVLSTCLDIPASPSQGEPLETN